MNRNTVTMNPQAFFDEGFEQAFANNLEGGMTANPREEFAYEALEKLVFALPTDTDDVSGIMTGHYRVDGDSTLPGIDALYLQLEHGSDNPYGTMDRNTAILDLGHMVSPGRMKKKVPQLGMITARAVTDWPSHAPDSKPVASETIEANPEAVDLTDPAWSEVLEEGTAPTDLDYSNLAGKLVIPKIAQVIYSLGQNGQLIKIARPS